MDLLENDAIVVKNNEGKKLDVKKAIKESIDRREDCLDNTVKVTPVPEGTPTPM